MTATVLSAFAFFLSFATIGGMCGLIIWLSRLEDRIVSLEFRRIGDRVGKPYLWTPFGQEDVDHD